MLMSSSVLTAIMIVSALDVSSHFNEPLQNPAISASGTVLRDIISMQGDLCNSATNAQEKHM